MRSARSTRGNSERDVPFPSSASPRAAIFLQHQNRPSRILRFPQHEDRKWEVAFVTDEDGVRDLDDERVQPRARDTPRNTPNIDHVAGAPVAERLPIGITPWAGSVDAVGLSIVLAKRLAGRTPRRELQRGLPIERNEVLPTLVLLAARVGAVVGKDQHDL